MAMSCDKVGNLLLAKFSCEGANDTSVFIPASIVFWLLEHFPVNQDPSLRAPVGVTRITQQDWDADGIPRALSVNCKQFAQALRMTFELERKAGLTVLLDRANGELMRQVLEHFRKDLIDLDA